MKFKKIFPIVICSALLVGAGAAFAFDGVRSKQASKVNADTDVGEIEIAEVRNTISTSSVIYLLPTADYGLPDSWDNHYVAVGEEDGIFINGVKQNGASLVYAGTGSAHITLYYGLPAAASEGDTIEFKGSFACTGYSFSVNYATQRFAETWVHALEDYDTVSLADANMPNFSGAAIETSGADYAYVTDRADITKQKGFFGLTNDTGSYAFQFNYRKTATGTGWFRVLIGASGTLWSTGHFIDYGFLDAWADTGHAQIAEMRGSGDNWTRDVIQETGAIALGWNVGETNLLEMGLIKVKGSAQRYIFFKVNGTLKFGEYWTLDSTAGGMTTKVTMQYAGTDAIVSNSIDVVGTERLHTADGTTTGLYTINNICPAVSNWSDYFMPVVNEGLTKNGVSFRSTSYNCFKKTGSANFYLDLPGAGYGELNENDVLYLGGIFKAAREVDGVLTLFKAVFADSYFEYDGTAWHELDPNYLASDFAKDLLKLTLTICTGEGGDNGETLAAIWITLSSANYYGKLSNSEKADLAIEAGDSTVVVPTTSAGVDEMSDGEALGAALYRYDYCTLKYSLTNFINGRVPALASTEMRIVNNTTNVNVIILITTSIALVSASLFVVLHFVSRKRKQDR